MAWFVNQISLVREHGIRQRFVSFSKRIIKPILGWVESHPLARQKLIVFLNAIHLDAYAKSVYRRLNPTISFAEISGIEKVLSYEDWCLTFDTPPNHILESWDLSRSEHRVFVMVTNNELLSNSPDLIKSIVGSVGVTPVVCCIGQSSNDLEMLSPQKAQQEIYSNSFLDRYTHIFIVSDEVVLRQHGLRGFVEAFNYVDPNVTLLYSDRDTIGSDGKASNPWFKPEYSELLLKQGMLLDGVIALKPSESAIDLLKQALALQSLTDESLIDFALCQGRHAIAHVPHVFYHCQFDQRPLKCVHHEALNDYPKAGLIIPTRDRWDLLGPCLQSLFETEWPSAKMDIVIVDNGSTDSETLLNLKDLAARKEITLLKDQGEFNWSRLNNLAAASTDADLLVFLNNDTKVYDRDWLHKLAIHAMRPEVGAVGCKLLYPDRTVQHGGVIAGIQGVAGHGHLFLEETQGGYQGLANITRETSAVTGACLAVSRKNFDAVGGFDENFKVAFNDVMFCFSLLQLGLNNIYVADPLFIHYESKSRGYDDTAAKKEINRQETMKAWAAQPGVMREDPYYSPNLSLWKPYDIAFAPRRRAVWDKSVSRKTRVMFLSATHAVGHGVPVVIALQAQGLLDRGFEVFIGGPISSNDFPYAGCHRLEISSPIEAAIAAAVHNIDVVIPQTPPFFSIARWTGQYPKVLAYDHGEPPSAWFPDELHRNAILAEKDSTLMMCHTVYAISEAIASESRTPVTGIIPEGNTHLGLWSAESQLNRNRNRVKYAWNDKFIVLNVCRFHKGERYYKGVDVYAEVAKVFDQRYPHLKEKVVFVLCGKGTEEDVAEMTELGLSVHANVSNSEMFDLYTAADGYINFSQWEGFNLGVAQALAMGLPVIASDIPAHRAFGVMTTDRPEIAAKAVAEWVDSNVGDQRKAITMDWNASFDRLADAIKSLSNA